MELGAPLRRDEEPPGPAACVHRLQRRRTWAVRLAIHYCKEPIFPLDKTAAMINMDMIGRPEPVPVDWLGLFGNAGPARRLRDRHRRRVPDTGGRRREEGRLQGDHAGRRHRTERSRLVLPQEGPRAVPLHRDAPRVSPTDRRAGEDQRAGHEEGRGLRRRSWPTICSPARRRRSSASSSDPWIDPTDPRPRGPAARRLGSAAGLRLRR